MNNTSNPIKEPAQNTNDPTDASTQGLSTDHNNVLDKTERKSNSNQEKEVLDGKSQVTEVPESKSQVNQTAIDNGTVTIVHNTESLPISEFVTDMNRTTDTLPQAQHDQKTKTWLERGKTSSPTINQVDQVQPTQAQGPPQYYPPPGYPPGQQGYQGYPPQGYPPQGYPPQGYPPPGYPPPGYPPPGSPPPGQPPPGQPPPGRRNRQQPEPPEPEDETTSQVIPYDPKTRNRFVAKTLLIVTIMLLITAAPLFVVALVVSEIELKKKERNFIFLIIIAVGIVGWLLTDAALRGFEAVRHIPFNIGILCLLVIFMTCILTAITGLLNTMVFAFGVLAMAIATFVGFVLACTSFNFSKPWIYVVMIATTLATLALFIFVGSKIIEQEVKGLVVLLAVVFITVQTFIIAYEMQLVLEGKTAALGGDEAIIASFSIYSSMVDIIYKLVKKLIRKRRRRRGWGGGGGGGRRRRRR